MTGRPWPRKRARRNWICGTMSRAAGTSMASPGSRKARCMSTTSRALLSGMSLAAEESEEELDLRHDVAGGRHFHGFARIEEGALHVDDEQGALIGDELQRGRERGGTGSAARCRGRQALPWLRQDRGRRVACRRRAGRSYRG